MADPTMQPGFWPLEETYKSLIGLAVEGLKTLALLNGGAAAGVMTYLGNLATRSPASSPLPAFKPAILCFAGGLLLTLTAFMIAYLVQLWVFRGAAAQRGDFALNPSHIRWTIAGVAMSAGAGGLFAAGCWLAADALTGAEACRH